MKISGSGLSGIYSLNKNNIRNGKLKEKSFNSALNTVAQDSVTISGDRDMSDEEFAAALGRRISSEVRAGASAQDMSDIKQQIALGTYDINVNDIIKKIIS